MYVLVLVQNNDGTNNDFKALDVSDLRSRTTSKQQEPTGRRRSKKISSKEKHGGPYHRDASTPTAAHSGGAANAIKHELELERRSASCRRSKDARRHLSESHTNTDNSHQESTNITMSTSVCNTLQRNYGGRSGGGYADGAEILRRTYYRGGIIGRKAKSNDFLDRMDTSMTNSAFGALGTTAYGMSGSVTGGFTSISQSSSADAKMSRIGIMHY